MLCFRSYDALPGYGPNKDEVAHACGHNWIAASTLGAALTLAKFKDQINGTIVVIGAPAEETTGGKCDIANRGGYDDIDAALQFHLGAENNMNIMTLAMDSIEFRFTVLHPMQPPTGKRCQCSGRCKPDVCRNQCNAPADKK